MNEWSGVGHMGGMWLWWIFGIVIIAAVAWAVIVPLSRKEGDQGTSAEELLKRRYASGEINKEEYEERLQDLRK